MDRITQERLMEFLRSAYDCDSTIYFLALSAKETERDLGTSIVNFKLRVALTYHEDDAVCPYFDGTELFVEVGPANIKFANEEGWADGPPLMEGSPNELALPWVSELAPPFYISREAEEEAVKKISLKIKTVQDFDVLL